MMSSIMHELLDIRLIADNGTHIPVSIPPESPLILIPSEGIVVSNGKQICRVGKKQLIILHRGGGEWSLTPEAGERFGDVCGILFQSYRLVHRDAQNLHYSISIDHLPGHGHVIDVTRYAAALIASLLEEARSSGSLLLAESPKMRLLLQELIEEISSQALFAEGLPVRDKSIRQVTEYIASNFAKPLTRASTAQLVGFNESYFSSLFRKETGWGFGEYVNRARIDEAKRLLLASTQSLGEIAYRTGFSDASYFGKAFQRVALMSPGSFRKRRGARRIAAMQFYGALLAIGVKPLAGTYEIWRSSALLHEELGELVLMEHLAQTEVLEALELELIVAPAYYYHYPEVLKALERIAPVVLIPWGERNKLEEVRELGGLLGRLPQAEQWITSYLAQGASAREVVQSFVKDSETAGIYELWYEDQWMIPHWPVRSTYNLYEILGLKAPKRIEEEVLGLNKAVRIKEQELPLYAASHMFVIVPGKDPESYRSKLMQRKVWRRLVQEQGCRLYMLSLDEFWMDEGVSLQKQLTIMVSLLTGE